MSSLILSDKSDTTVTMLSKATTKALDVMNMKLEDRRPSFLNRSPLLTGTLDILQPKAATRSSYDINKRQAIIDQLAEAEALLEDVLIFEQQQPAHQMTFQEDPTWVEFCKDLPLE
jgi:hypothetical protein